MKPKRIRIPMASPFGKSCSARLLFTMARRGWCWSSASTKSRPRSRGIPRARKKPGETDAAFVIRRMPVLESAVIGETVSCQPRSEEHTSELQSHHDLVCRLLLEKKKENRQKHD